MFLIRFLQTFYNKKIYNFRIFFVQNISMKIPYWSSKLMEKPPVLKSEHQALETRFSGAILTFLDPQFPHPYPS
jgi:hypothetical protein